MTKNTNKLKYSVFVVDGIPLLNRERKHVVIPELSTHVFCFVDEHSGSEDMAKWMLQKAIDRHIEARKLIEVDQKPLPPQEDNFLCEVDWKTELRIRVSNEFLIKGYNSFDDVVDALREQGTVVKMKNIKDLFCVFKKLDLKLMLEVIRVFKLPFKIQEVRFKYK